METEMKLHEAIIKVLSESEKETMTPQEIADEINKRKLYERGDKGTIPSSQISARVNQYSHLFNKRMISRHSFISLKS